MQLKFKIEMLLSETRAFPGELKRVLHFALSVCPFVLSSFGYS